MEENNLEFDSVDTGLIFASTNMSKLDEYRRLIALLTAHVDAQDVQNMTESRWQALYSKELDGAKLIIHSPQELNLELDSVEETGMSLLENAGLKARAAWEKFKRPCFADDSGTWVSGIGGPAIYTGRFAEDGKNMKKLIEQFNKLEEYAFPEYAPSKKMITSTVICLINEKGEEHYFTGSCEGILKTGFDKWAQEIKLDNGDPPYKNVMIPKQGDGDCNSYVFNSLDEMVHYYIGPKHNAMINMLMYLKRSNRLRMMPRMYLPKGEE